jgi:glycosyltransferase involved in cell wall biosynthesis
MPLGKVHAFFNGIYSLSSRRAMKHLLKSERPDLIHIHNLFPFISPSVLPECRHAGIPVVMTVHNYRLVCPNGLYLTKGRICTRCSRGREYWCILKNCEGNSVKSLGYALRNIIGRKTALFSKNITIYTTPTKFIRDHLIDEGFPSDRITVIPNMVNKENGYKSTHIGDYVGFVGRVSHEKGIETLIQAARICDDIPFKVAGDCHRLPDLPDAAPDNIEFLGFLKGDQLKAFYSDARLLVTPSLWYEAFGLCTVEAMLHGKPVISSRIGGLPEIVEDGTTGVLFEPGNAEKLAEAIRYLWNRPELSQKMGLAGKRKALQEYSPAKYYDRLLSVYNKAIKQGETRWNKTVAKTSLAAPSPYRMPPIA